MRKNPVIYVLAVLLIIFLSGCVSSAKYEKKTAEADGLAADIKSLQRQYDNLTQENNALKNQYKNLTADFAKLTTQRDKIVAERDELDRVLKAKSDTLSKLISELRDKNIALEKENEALKENIVALKKAREEEVRTVSKTYESLMEEMKGEIAQGQITITELKGRLTLDVVDKILFASGETEIKPEGLVILKRVTEILKDVKDKAIRIEGHTDNVKIGDVLARRYPTNWELSAARALNVTRYLEKQGIDPSLLAAVAYGEYKPIADNATPDGRAKNRRIAIILQPKD